MGAAATTANVPQILKNIWKDEIHDFQYENMPFYGQVEKDPTWDGLYQIITVQYGGMSGRSATFSDAKENKGPPKYKQMQVPTSDNFALWSVDHKLITLSRNQRGALVRALAESTEKAFTKIKRSMGWMMWRNFGGSVGKIKAASGITGSVAELQDINDVRNFDLDDVVQASLADGRSGSVKGTALTVTAIDEDTGKITFSADLVASGWANSDFLFHKGDFGKAFYGVADYIPLAAPNTGSEPNAVHGMQRSDFPTRLGGHRFSASTANLADEVKVALTKAFRRSCNITDLYTGPEAFDEIEGELGTLRRYVDVNVGRVGFKGLEFTAQSGQVVKLFSDPDIPKSANGKRLLYGLNMDSWKLHTAKEFPMWLNAEGKKEFMTEENTNSSEGRVGGYGQLYTDAPGDNFVLEFTA